MAVGWDPRKLTKIGKLINIARSLPMPVFVFFVLSANSPLIRDAPGLLLLWDITRLIVRPIE